MLSSSRPWRAWRRRPARHARSPAPSTAVFFSSARLFDDPRGVPPGVHRAADCTAECGRETGPALLSDAPAAPRLLLYTQVLPRTITGSAIKYLRFRA